MVLELPKLTRVQYGIKLIDLSKQIQQKISKGVVGLELLGRLRGSIRLDLVQEWLHGNFQRFWPKIFRPPSLPDLNVMDFAIWGILARKAYDKPHKNLDSLKRSLITAWNDLDADMIRVHLA